MLLFLILYHHFTFSFSYDKYGSLGRKESMGRYRKFQAANSNSAAGLSMGSPRLVARNMSFQMAKTQFDPVVRDSSPRYANVQLQPKTKSSPIMGRRAMGPPQPPPVENNFRGNGNYHRRQMSDIPQPTKHEVRKIT